MGGPPDVMLSEPDDVLAALADDDLVPHAVADPSTGATMEFRASMARFSHPETHERPRRAVEELLASIDVDELGDTAAELAGAWLAAADDAVDAVELASRVPVRAVADLLGLDADDLVIDDVHRVVAVIGRGAAATAESDAATERLLACCADAGHDPIAAASLLYQTCDATAALVLCHLLAEATGSPAVAAVPRTRRTSRREVRIGSVTIAPGTNVTLEIGAAGAPFGAGRHECPGRVHAEAIVAAVERAVVVAGSAVDLTSVALDDDGRPTALSLVRSPGATTA